MAEAITGQPRNALGQFISAAGGESATTAAGRSAHANYRIALGAAGVTNDSWRFAVAIGKGDTVENVYMYSLKDTATPVEIIAADSISGISFGSPASYGLP